MKTKSALLIAVLSIAILTAGTVNAQRNEKNLNKNVDKSACIERFAEAKEKRNEKIQPYIEKNVKPQMVEWKALIDKTFSKEDLAKLNELRNNAAKERIKSKESVKELMGRIKSGDATKNDMGDLREKLKSTMKEIGGQLKPILEKYPDLVKQVSESAKIKGETWKSDMKNLIGEKNENNADEKNSKISPENKGKYFIARIFLWDGVSNFEGFFDFAIKNDNKPRLIPEDFKLNVTPNPVTNNAKVTFVLPKKDNVKVTIQDVYGRVVLKVFSGELTQGAHDIEFEPTSDMLTGAYVLRIESEKGSLIKRFNVKK